MKELIENVLASLFDVFYRKGEKKDILFIVHNEAMFSHIRPIYELLREDDRLNLSFFFQHPELFVSGKLEALISSHKIRSVNYVVAWLYSWDLVIYPDHGVVTRDGTKRIYTGHGLETGKTVDNQSYIYGPPSLDKNNNVIYEKIFCSNENEKIQVKEYFPNFYPHVRVVGNLLADEMFSNARRREGTIKSLGLSTANKTVFITSTWGPESLIQTHGPNLLRKIGGVAESYNVIIFLHQNNFVAKYSGEIDWETELKKINRRNTYVVLDRRDPQPLLAASDILITDITSLGLYFSLLSRPIVLVHNEKIDIQPGSIYSDYIAAVYKVNTIININELLETAFEVHNQEAVHKFSEKIFCYQGQANKRIADELYGSLDMEVPTLPR